MKIYTKTGDNGSTSLANGKRVSKSNEFVNLYGISDELNSLIGVSISFLKENSSLKESLQLNQNLLFELGSELAMFRPKNESISIIQIDDIKFLENEIDRMQEKLIPLKKFVLPGGSKASAFLHVARTKCRELERMMVKAKEENLEIFENSLIYVNRLSDFLFVCSRFVNSEENIEDITWTSRAKEKK
jgi:cob(I)alamin adenosyltransferase